MGIVCVWMNGAHEMSEKEQASNEIVKMSR